MMHDDFMDFLREFSKLPQLEEDFWIEVQKKVEKNKIDQEIFLMYLKKKITEYKKEKSTPFYLNQIRIIENGINMLRYKNWIIEIN